MENEYTDSEDETLDREIEVIKYNEHESITTVEVHKNQEDENSNDSNTEIHRKSWDSPKEERLEKKLPRRRWSKDTGIVCLPTTSFSPESTIVSKKKKKYNYISIIIHKSEKLKIFEKNFLMKCPMVKVHLMTANNGNYLKTSKSNYIQPMMTKKCDFEKNQSIVPVWEERLIFPYDFEAMNKTHKQEEIIILFEIIDLLSFDEASVNYEKFGAKGCWHEIAWGFFKPYGNNNTIRMNQRVRLQLYKPAKNHKKSPHKHDCEVYTWWKSGIRKRYSSTLFITLTSTESLKSDPEIIQNSYPPSDNIEIKTEHSIDLLKTRTVTFQPCQIPNDLAFHTEIVENGCCFVKFSNTGQYMAYVASEEYDYSIIIYELETIKINVRFIGHKKFVYHLNWSEDDQYLLSVSSDQTARLWDVCNKIIQPIQILLHPSHVYCGKFQQKQQIITGCHDRIVRIWTKTEHFTAYEPSQELTNHEGSITSIYNKNNNFLTADNVGVIIIWTSKTNPRILTGIEWYLTKKIQIRNVIINTIILHPKGTKLLVHSRNNDLRIVDIRTGVTLKKCDGLFNQRLQITSCLSPCGSLIFSGGEDSSITVWDFETGHRLGKYNIFKENTIITCVDYHPKDHIIAYTSFGLPSAVKVLRYVETSTGQNVGLKLTESTKSKNFQLEVLQIQAKLTSNNPSIARLYTIIEKIDQILSNPKSISPNDSTDWDVIEISKTNYSSEDNTQCSSNSDSSGTYIIKKDPITTNTPIPKPRKNLKKTT